MESLYLPDLDLSQRPVFNIHENDYWSLINEDVRRHNALPCYFSKQECEEIIKIGKSFGVSDSFTGDGRSFSELRKSRNSWLRPSELTRWIYEKIQCAVFEANKQYGFDLHSIECIQFTEYDDSYSGYYGKHSDELRVESPNTFRKLTCSIQLSETSVYEGGDLLLYPTCDTPIVASKEQGTVNCFPSFVLHEVTPVTRGTRYSLIAWASGPKLK